MSTALSALAVRTGDTSRPAARPSAAKTDKHDAILRAATRVFARHGFFNAQVADVAREAGVAAGTVYLYFRSKDDLLASIFERTMRTAIDEGRAALSGVTDPLARLTAIARLHLDRLGRDRDLAIVFQVELRQSIKHMERFSSTLLREYLGIIRGVIADGQSAGVFRQDVKATTVAKILFGALDEMATNWILSRRRYALTADANEVVDLLVGGLRRPAPDQSAAAIPLSAADSRTARHERRRSKPERSRGSGSTKRRSPSS
ncbi:MAG: TetR/AcrR family transcriptional regulator [Acidobacteria bacterium]|nr:TetR/AcrR family transcriptional regulator [Acidobacteriota bacterium]